VSLDIYLSGQCDVGTDEPIKVELYEANITHNVTPMWRKAGVYEALYKSDGKMAKEVGDVIKRGVCLMELHPDEYKKLNPPNGWGSYEGALEFLFEFAMACDRYPKAIIRVWA
jgi:hypothetical protein